jgi:hypothetical protein
MPPTAPKQKMKSLTICHEANSLAAYHHPQQKIPGAKDHPLAFENLS